MTIQRALQVVPTADQALPAIWIAFATSDIKQVDAHFGSANRFAIYRIDAQTAQLDRIVVFAPAAMDGHEDKLTPRLNALEGCAAVYCREVGASAVRQLVQRGVRPVRLTQDTSVDQLLTLVCKQVANGEIQINPLARTYRTNEPLAETMKKSLEEECWEE
ncbi:MAG: nitrogen fixation protein NifX [Magnetococcales bacterium]|nr:nitrogen fixation protein NifX [Magnetococcales bacterium]